MPVGLVPVLAATLMTTQSLGDSRVVPPPTPRPDLPGETILVRTLAQDPAQKYFLYIPPQGGVGAPVLVTIHGVSRNAREHMRYFAPFAKRYGTVLVAPLFPADRFPHYQRLEYQRADACAQCMLEQIMAEVGGLTGANTDKLYMFGYSGGGQFVHRYAMAYPQQVAGIVVGAAGWYTAPDPSLRYPLGVKPVATLPDVRFHPTQFLKVPACVLVGAKDTRRDSKLRKQHRVDRHQGATRLERGKRWLEAMATAARAYHLDTRYSFQVLPRCGHSFATCMKRGEMGQRVFEFLFPPAQGHTDLYRLSASQAPRAPR